ncbi:MAG: enterobactin esterase, partial [Planctomycetota bacterium]
MENKEAWNFLWGLVTLCISLLSSEIAYGQDLTTKKSYGPGNGDFVVGPDYRLDPDLSDRGNPKGKQFEFRMSLAESKIFPGTDATLDS